MFPLGTVLFPHGLLPLHVFEPRYRLLTERCLAGDRTFGVVLIERGHEVGGGDSRFDIGTLAQIVQAGRFEDGRYALVTVGKRRLRVRRWLTDDPYPRADIELLDDVAGSATREQIDEVARTLRRVLALHAELGTPVGSTDVALADDPVQASFEAAARAPLQPLDALELLALDDASERLARLSELLHESAAVLEFRLGNG